MLKLTVIAYDPNESDKVRFISVEYINNKHEITFELQNKYHNTLLSCRQFNLK